jgi:3-oxoacyl-[acyl-carrier protein] reductase
MSFQLTLPKKGAAVVMGGSGGVGAEICRTLASIGTPVALTYFRGESRANTVCDELDKSGTDNGKFQVDTRNLESVEQMMKQVSERFGAIHTVICATGPTLQFRTLSEVDVNKWRENIDSDINGAFNIIRAAIPHLRQSRGTLVALSTMANHRIISHDATSACPKAAVETLVRQLAYEEGINGIRANTVALGAINAGMGTADADSSILEEMGEEGIAAIVEKIRLENRIGSAQELANAVAFLVSDQASYITGQTLLVDGGWTL